MPEIPPIDAILAPGMGPVRPQLRGPEGARTPVADFERMRVIALASKELAARGLLNDNGYIIPTGAATLSEDDLLKAFESRPVDMGNLIQAEKVKISLSGEQDAMTPHEFLEKFPMYAKRQNIERIRGKPATEKEAALLRQTSEAGLMTDLIKKAHVKANIPDRVTIPQTIIEENEAKDTIENVVRNINALDDKAGGVWDGTIAVVTSNFGHISRIEEILQAFGIPKDKIVGLSAETVLRHFGYSKPNPDGSPSFLDRYEAENASDATLQNQERWRRGVREMPVYVLPKIALVKNDQRLMQVMSGLRTWYGVDKLAAVDPQLATFELLSPSVLRAKLASIERQKPPEEWGKVADLDEWKREIAEYKVQTEQWLETHKPK